MNVRGDKMFKFTKDIGIDLGTANVLIYVKGQGIVCGTAWKLAETVVVPDVDELPGHIACSSASKSEIVVPVFGPDGSEVIAVLDIDSAELATFDEVDKQWLEKIVMVL